MKKLKSFVKSFASCSGYKIVKNRPDDTLETVKLALAYYAKSNPDCSIVQVGACDGKSHDPIYDFLISGLFSAILIEPLPENFRLLQETYATVEKIRLINAAVSDAGCSQTIYSVKQEGRWENNNWVKQFASFDKKHLFKQGVRDAEIEELTVPTITVAQLHQQFNLERIDLLVVDTEGFDDVVVRMALDMPSVPQCIFFEFVHLRSGRLRGLFEILRNKGYVWSFGTGNVICVHSDLEHTWTA